jgi:hypothetical protein
MLSKARNTFMAVQKARKQAEADRDRRAALGIVIGESEVAAAVTVQVENLRAAKLRAAERRAAKEAATEQLPTDSPNGAVAEDDDEASFTGGSSFKKGGSFKRDSAGSDEVKEKIKGSGIMKAGSQKTPRKFIHAWYLAKQNSVDDEGENEEDVALHVSGEFAKLTDGEKPSKSSKAKQSPDTKKTRSRRGQQEEEAAAQVASEEIVYEYGYVEFGPAGAGRKKVQAAEASLATQLTPLARQLISFSTQLADLAQRPELAERPSESVTSAALLSHLEKSIDHLALMLDSETQQIKESASTTLGVMLRCNSAFKGKIATDQRIVDALTKLMNEGVLEAISAVECLLAGNEEACNQAREAGVRRCEDTSPSPPLSHLSSRAGSVRCVALVSSAVL